MGGAVSWVADRVSDAVSWVGDKVCDALDWVSDKLDSLIDTPSYDRDNATVDQTKVVNELIQKCVDDYEPYAREFEDIAKEVLLTYLDKIHNSLDGIHEDVKIPNYIFNNLKNETKALNKQIEGLYIGGINNVFSLNNNELLDILKLDSGSSKGDKLKKLAIKTLEESHDNFTSQIGSFLDEQQDLLVNELKQLKTNFQDEYDKVEDEFEKLRIESLENNDFSNIISSYSSQIQLLNKINMVEIKC